MNSRFLLAAAWGVLIGALTFSAGPLGALSAHKAIAAIYHQTDGPGVK